MLWAQRYSEVGSALSCTGSRMTELRNLLILIWKRNSQWPRWGLSGSVCIQLCAPIFSHVGASHQFSSVTMSDHSDLHPHGSAFIWLVHPYIRIQESQIGVQVRKKEFINVELDARSRELKASPGAWRDVPKCFTYTYDELFLFWKSCSRISCAEMRIRNTAARTLFA